MRVFGCPHVGSLGCNVRHSRRTHNHLCEYMYTNSIPMSTFEELRRLITRFTKSPQAPQCQWDVVYH
jgi:hypothetical protein